MNNIMKQGLSDNISKELDILNQSLIAIGKDENTILGELLSYALINSGKRIRPMLVMLGASLGKPNRDHVQSLGLAVELIHIATLVHDDIIDKAELRRGQKTVASKHGADKAVLLGDYLYTLAFNRVIRVDNYEVMALFVNAASVICRGEFEQLTNKNHYNLSEEEYYSFIERKTASFFGASIRSGAIIAGQNQEIKETLESYGINLGMAFQIKDDLLDLTGDEDVVGKTLRTDLLNGKMTLPLINYRKNMDSAKEFDRLMDSIKQSDEHISKLVNLVKEAGSIEYAEDIARNYIQKAVDCLEVLPQGESRDQLAVLAENSLHRES